MNVSVLGVQYGLFTHTHDGYGLNDAFDRSVSLLMQDSRDSGQVRKWPLATTPFACGDSARPRFMRSAGVRSGSALGDG